MKLKNLYALVNKKIRIGTICLVSGVMLAACRGPEIDRKAMPGACRFENAPRLVAAAAGERQIEWETASACPSAVIVLSAESQCCRGNAPDECPTAAQVRTIVQRYRTPGAAPETNPRPIPTGAHGRTHQTALFTGLESDREYRYVIILPGENNFRTGTFRTASSPESRASAASPPESRAPTAATPSNNRAPTAVSSKETLAPEALANRRRFRALPFIQNLLGDEVTITYQTREAPGLHAALAIRDDCPASAGSASAKSASAKSASAGSASVGLVKDSDEFAKRILTRAGDGFEPGTDDNVRHMRLRGLAPAGTYRYYVLLEGKDRFIGGNDFSFIAPSAVGTRFSFYVYGDSRTQLKERRAVIQTMRQYGDRLRARGDFPGFILGTGDYAATGCDEKFVQWLADANPILRNMPLFAAIGNHERDCRKLFNRKPLYRRYFVKLPGPSLKEWKRERTVYSFDYLNSRFIALDIDEAWDDGGLRSPVLMSFLLEKLRAPKSIEHIFLFYHAPMISQLAQGGHPTSKFQVKELAPLLQKEGAGRVVAVFTGHNHFYERSHPLRNVRPAERSTGVACEIDRTCRRGFTHIVTGGAGAPLRAVPAQEAYEEWLAKAASVYHFLHVQVDGSKVSGAAINVKGEAFDVFTLREPR